MLIDFKSTSFFFSFHFNFFFPFLFKIISLQCSWRKIGESWLFSTFPLEFLSSLSFDDHKSSWWLISQFTPINPRGGGKSKEFTDDWWIRSIGCLISSSAFVSLFPFIYFPSNVFIYSPVWSTPSDLLISDASTTSDCLKIDFNSARLNFRFRCTCCPKWMENDFRIAKRSFVSEFDIWWEWLFFFPLFCQTQTNYVKVDSIGIKVWNSNRPDWVKLRFCLKSEKLRCDWLNRPTPCD